MGMFYTCCDIMLLNYHRQQIYSNSAIEVITIVYLGNYSVASGNCRQSHYVCISLPWAYIRRGNDISLIGLFSKFDLV